MEDAAHLFLEVQESPTQPPLITNRSDRGIVVFFFPLPALTQMCFADTSRLCALEHADIFNRAGVLDENIFVFIVLREGDSLQSAGLFVGKSWRSIAWSIRNPKKTVLTWAVLSENGEDARLKKKKSKVLEEALRHAVCSQSVSNR